MMCIYYKCREILFHDILLGNTYKFPFNITVIVSPDIGLYALPANNAR